MSDPILEIGDCLEVMKLFPDASVDACICDPPYSLAFMGRSWDTHSNFQEWCEKWGREVLRILKPGAHLLAFGHPRTYHRLVCGLEDAGFESRDTIQYLYGSGFPKSHNLALGIDKHFGHENRGRAIPTASTYQASDTKELNKLTSNPVEDYVPKTEEAAKWVGWGNNLKPACEPISMLRRPLIGTIAKNVLEYGTGGINIDACRIPGDPVPINKLEQWSGFGQKERPDYTPTVNTQGRWPANVVLDEEAAQFLDEETGTLSSGSGNTRTKTAISTSMAGPLGVMDREQISYGDSGGASRFFYCSKASKKEKTAGLEDKNTHPTVKPIDLMRYLVKLVTPPGGIVLDPFLGSGTTGIAAILEGFDFIGIEQSPEYMEIAKARISHWSSS